MKIDTLNFPFQKQTIFVGSIIRQKTNFYECILFKIWKIPLKLIYARACAR